jgi:hypothetical protein
MIVLPCTQATFYDVDDTLVMWGPTKEQLDKYGIEIECPESVVWTDEGPVSIGKWKEKLVPHIPHIEQLKKHKMRGHTIIVWSAGGWDWAAAAVKALGLEKYVDLVISKPTWIYDDKKPEEFMPKPYYFPVQE